MPASKKSPAKKVAVKKAVAKKAAANTAAFGLAPLTLAQVEQELLAVWDADSWLTLPVLTERFKADKSLDSVGITPLQAESYVNKYNSIIVRKSALNTRLVKPSEARSWASKAMKWIAKTVFDRATA